MKVKRNAGTMHYLCVGTPDARESLILGEPTPVPMPQMAHSSPP